MRCGLVNNLKVTLRHIEMKGRSTTKKSASKPTATSSATTPSRQINVWTDGACLANGQKGARAGIGVYFSEGDARNLSERLSGERQTNQRAEMMASIRAIEIIRAGHKAESERKEKSPVATKPAQSELLVKFPPILSKSQVETLAGKTEEESTKKRKKMSSKSIDLSANAMSEDSTEELATGKKKRKTKATKLNLTEDSNNDEEATITLSPISVIPKRLPPLIKPIPFPSALSPISLVTQKTAPIPSAPVDATSSNSSNDSAAIASPPPLLVRVHTDSKYVINGVMSWMPNWKANQWRRGKGKPTEKNAIVNLDLWQRLDRLIIGSSATNTNQASATTQSAASNSAGEVLFEWIHVEGHSGDVGNEAADKLAKSACQLEEVARNGVGE